ncbi:MAG: peptidoglycan DD-metalloendopeptidase family protein [Pseudomonadota bacterium]
MTKASTGALVLLLTAPVAAAPLPAIRAVPGGLITLPVTSAEAVVTVGGQRQPIVAVDDGYRALVGIPLSARGTIDVTLESGTATLELGTGGYREQRLTIARQDHVTPSAEQLARYRRERAALDAAIGAYRERSDWQLSFPWPQPVAGHRSATFGARRFFNDQPRSPHSGMDIAAPSGTPVAAPAAGDVTLVDDLFFNGKTVVVDHGHGVTTLYCHLDSYAVAVGDRVIPGQMLGRVGATGRVTGAHLHWSVYVGGAAIDPALTLSAGSE